MSDTEHLLRSPENARRLRSSIAQFGCTCQACGRRYFVDLMVPDAAWEQIKPEGKPEGAGMLCPACIGERLEALAAGECDCYYARKEQ